jgi:hypothetical protein
MHFAARTIIARATLALFALAILVVAQPARSEPSMHLQVDWFRVVARNSNNIGLLRGNMFKAHDVTITTVRRGPVADDGGNGLRRSDADIASALQLDAPTNATPWFGVGPEISVVARDWGGAKSLLGGEIAVTDAIRPSRSYRLALTRIRLGTGRIAPFAQIGLGEYRIDNDVVATHMKDTEVAGQVGGGVELHVAKTSKVEWDVAAETCLTQIVRNEREPQNVAASRMWSSLIASRIRF